MHASAQDAPVTSGVYAIVCLQSGRRYVGSSVNIRRRIRQHIARLSAGNHHSVALQRAWDKYGHDQFQMKILGLCGPDHLIACEQNHMDQGSEYNTSKVAGRTEGVKASPETRAKLSALFKGRRLTEAQREARRGRRHSAETIEKMRMAHAGNQYAAGTPKSPEHRAKIGQKSRGRPLSEESRQKIAEKARGRPVSEDARAKMSASRKGKASRSGFVTPPEVRAKIALANLGQKRTPEAIERMRQAAKAVWDKRRAAAA